MKKILILGSSGQIGKHLVEFLKNKNYYVDEFDIEISNDHDMRVYNNSVLKNSIKQADFVFFLAFDVGGSKYLNKYQDTYTFINNNVNIMSNTFKYLSKYNKPFIFASSQMSNMLYSNYGILKALGESYTKSINGRIIKLWNVYGYESNPEKYHAISDFIIKAKDTGIINMISDGEEERDLLYVDDCCEALEMIMNNYEIFSPDTNIHIASFNSIKIRHVANIVANNFNAKVVPSEKKDEVQKDKRNEPDRFILQYWQPKTDIFSGIKKVIERVTND